MGFDELVIKLADMNCGMSIEYFVEYKHVFSLFRVYDLNINSYDLNIEDDFVLELPTNTYEISRMMKYFEDSIKEQRKQKVPIEYKGL